MVNNIEQNIPIGIILVIIFKRRNNMSHLGDKSNEKETQQSLMNIS